MNILDTNPNVLSWSSEELVIPYFDPVQSKRRRYFPDFLVKVRSKNNSIQIFIIEIKPDFQTNLRFHKKTSKKLLEEAAVIATNNAKWEAATKIANDKGWKFIVLTEKNCKFFR